MLNIETPLNTLSIGQVGIQILKELFKRKIDINLLPIGNVDLSGYDLADDFKLWLKEKADNSLANFKNSDKTLKIWHINGSQAKISNESYIYTFHELDSLTPQEINIMQNVAGVFVACDFNAHTFKANGIKNVWKSSPGFFDYMKEETIRPYGPQTTTWLITGKFEKRKAHLEAIKGWWEKFGKTQSHMLHICCQNPFLPPQAEAEKILLELELDHVPTNFNFMPYAAKNADYCKILNACDIIIDMSRGESFSLPSFHCVGLGKHAIVHDATGMQAWATAKNSVLVPSTGKMDPWDGTFFHPGQPFNQGKYFTWKMDDYKNALEIVLNKKMTNPMNDEGKKIQKDFTFAATVDTILTQMGIPVPVK